MPEIWSHLVELIVSDYFKMLTDEVAGMPYSKAEHRRILLPLLANRSESSIEFKHQNISAVLANHSLPYINGYKPAWNYQKLLEQVVMDYVAMHKELEATFRQFAEAVPANAGMQITFEQFEETRPERQSPIVLDPKASYRSPVKVNYIELEQANKAIGDSGEKLVYEYERWRLIREGKESLADKIEWVSLTKGDGLGFDILSRNRNGTDRFIEVKSTKLTKEAPFYFSKNELAFSRENQSNYYLYRVFNLKTAPKVFIANGGLDEICNTEPVKFKGYF